MRCQQPQLGACEIESIRQQDYLCCLDPEKPVGLMNLLRIVQDSQNYTKLLGNTVMRYVPDLTLITFVLTVLCLMVTTNTIKTQSVSAPPKLYDLVAIASKNFHTKQYDALQSHSKNKVTIFCLPGQFELDYL